MSSNFSFLHCPFMNNRALASKMIKLKFNRIRRGPSAQQIRHHLGHPHPMLYLSLSPGTAISFSFLLIYRLGIRTWWLKQLCPGYPGGRPGLNSWLQLQHGPVLAFLNMWEISQHMRGSSFALSLPGPLSFFLFICFCFSCHM